MLLFSGFLTSRKYQVPPQKTIFPSPLPISIQYYSSSYRWAGITWAECRCYITCSQSSALNRCSWTITILCQSWPRKSKESGRTIQENIARHSSSTSAPEQQSQNRIRGNQGLFHMHIFLACVSLLLWGGATFPHVFCSSDQFDITSLYAQHISLKIYSHVAVIQG